MAGGPVINIGSGIWERECQIYTSDMRIKVADTESYTYPDISVSCGIARFEDASKDTLLNPVLLVEVLSASTEIYDRGIKFQHYRKIESLKEYVLVSQDRCQIERFLRRSDGEWSSLVVTGLENRIFLRSVEYELVQSTVDI